MNTKRFLLAAFLAASVLTVAAFAADPTGNWKWTSVTANGTVNMTATLALKDNSLTGTVTGRQGPAAISESTYSDGVVDFTVTRGIAGKETVFKYTGKLEGDAITGTIEKSAPATTAVKTAWNATRVP